MLTQVTEPELEVIFTKLAPSIVSFAEPEITKLNEGHYLGFQDGETAIFINEKNYKEKFEEYINDPDNPKWEQIANAGREYTMNNLTNEQAVSSLVELVKEII